MKIVIPIVGLLLLFCLSCNDKKDPVAELFKNETANLQVIYFFNKKKESEIPGLDIPLSVKVARSLSSPLQQKGYATQLEHDKEEEKIKEVTEYIKIVKLYGRFVIEFKTGSLKFRVFCTEKVDVTGLVMVAQSTPRARKVTEYDFAYDAILRMEETEKRSEKDDEFAEAVNEKVTTSMFSKNMLFSKVVNRPSKSAQTEKLDNNDAEAQIRQAFLIRQFCRDVVLNLKAQHTDWFEEK